MAPEKTTQPLTLGRREATMDDAPVDLTHEEANAWVNGFNTARDRLAGITDAHLAEIARLRAEATKERQDGYAQVNTLCDQITALRKERDTIEAERRVLLHEHTLALERSKRGVTDWSTPLHRRIENIVDALARADAERNTLREQLRREQDACDVCAEAADKYRNELELITQEHDKLKNIADAHRAAIAGLRACDELRAQAVHDVETMATALEEGTWSAPTIDSVPAIRALVKENMVLRHMEDMAREREGLLAQAEQAAMLHRRAYLEEHDKLAALMHAQHRDRC